MNCRYCGSNNAAADHRCTRCGRRLHLATARPAPDVYPVAGAGALSPQLMSAIAEPIPDVEPVPQPPKRAPYQPALFASRDLGRVVPIEAYQVRAAERSERAKQAEKSTRAATAAAQQHQQTNFAFAPSSGAAEAPTVRPTKLGLLRDPSNEARYSQAPVAIPMHRAMAAAVDLAMVMVAAGAVCMLVGFGMGGWVLPGKPLWWFAGLAGVLSLVYKLVWAAADADSPGLRWCQLKLLHFDGREPVRRERFERIASSLLSVMAGGLGLVWALVDEESLCWHDHSSRTFLTPFSRQPQVR